MRISGCGMLGATALVSAAVCVGGFAQEKPAERHWPTNEELRHLRGMGDARLSPDGTRVLVRVQESTADGAAGHLWVTEVAGDAAPRQLTFSPDGEKRGERGGEWMPDGRECACFWRSGASGRGCFGCRWMGARRCGLR